MKEVKLQYGDKTTGTVVYTRLDAPEFLPAYELVDGELVAEMVHNRAFLSESERPVYEFLLDLNPMGQAIQYCIYTRYLVVHQFVYGRGNR